MKVSKQIVKFRALLDVGARTKRKHRDELKSLLKDMKSKQKHLTKQVDTQSDTKKRRRLEREIELLHEQRKKGLKVLKDLNG